MRAMTLNEVRQAIRGRWLDRGEPIPIRGLSIDTRTASPGDLFVAIGGDKFDGHDFLQAAAQAGCPAAVVDQARDIDPEIRARFTAGVVGAGDTRTALGDLAGYYRSVIPATVVAVTGSNGKTTVKRMIDHILRTRFVGSCSPKSFNNEIGVPLTLLGAGGGDDYVVCEVGSNAPGEIAGLARIIKPDIAVVTNVAQAHLEKLGSLGQIATEKASLLGWLGERGLAVVWADSDELDMALKSYPHRMIRFGESDPAQLRLTGYEPDGPGLRFEINNHHWAKLALPGKHNAINALAAVAVCMKFGFSQAQATDALADFAGVEMRLEQIEVDGLRIINDAYNANPASCRAAVAVLVDCPAQRRVFVAGDMLELGQASEELHAELGKHLAREPVDVIVGVGPGGKIVAKNAGEFGKGKQIAFFDDTAAAAAEIADLLTAGDVVLLKGSRAMGLERLAEAIRNAKGNGNDL